MSTGDDFSFKFNCQLYMKIKYNKYLYLLTNNIDSNICGYLELLT